MSKKFHRTLDKATDSTLVDPNWDAILECVDLIRGGEATAKVALAGIQKRLHSENPHVAHHALLVLEACVKNCGPKFHAEVATNDFMHDLRDLAFENASEKVKNKILELLQCWSIAFKEKPEYKIVVDTQKTMEYEGVAFPKVSESEAMFIAESAPDWVDGDVCFRCRIAFGLLTRKHHCRACGQVFCDKCSNNQSYLPRYGIEKEVRVCDGCYEKLPSSKKKVSAADTLSSKLSGTTITESDDSAKAAEQKARELKEAEEYEMNLALAISQSEAEAREQERQRQLFQMFNGLDYSGSNEKILLNGTLETSKSDQPSEKDAKTILSDPEVSLDPELARYLNRDYWQKRKQEQKETATAAETRKAPIPSAPPPSEFSCSLSASRVDKANDVQSLVGPSITTQREFDADMTPVPHLPTDEEEQTAETMEFCRQIYDEVTKMVNRINSNRARNRSLFNDTAIQSLWSRLTAMLDQVKVRKTKLDQKKTYYESLMDRISNIKYTRAAVDQLREQFLREEEERKKREREEKQREMMQTAALLRHQKHLWLQTQQREQMRMLAQSGVIGYQRFFSTGGYPMMQTGAIPSPVQGVQTDSSFIQPSSPYPLYGYSGTTSVQASTPSQLTTTYTQVTQPSQIISAGQQVPDAFPETAVSMQQFSTPQAVSSSVHPTVAYSTPSLVYTYATSMTPQTGYPSSPATLNVPVTEQSISDQQQIPLSLAGTKSQVPVSIQQQFTHPAMQHQISAPGGIMQQITQASSMPQQLTHSITLPQQTSVSTQVLQQVSQSPSMSQQSTQGSQTIQQLSQPLQHQVPQSISMPQFPTSTQMFPVHSGLQEQMFAQQMPQQIHGIQSTYGSPSVPCTGQQLPSASYQQMAMQGAPQVAYPQTIMPLDQYFQGMAAMQGSNIAPQQTQTAQMQQPSQEGVIEGPLISFD